MNYCGDVKVYNTADGGAINFVGGQPDMECGLWSAVYISLFTERGWWGDPEIGSSLATLEDATLTNQLRLNVIEESKRALAWLVTNGIAESVKVEAEIPSASMLAIQVTIKEPGQTTPQGRRYEVNWSNLKEAF